MFGRILAAGLVLVVTCTSTGCYGFFFHHCFCRPCMGAGYGGPGEPAGCGCGCASYYPPGPIAPMPTAGPAALVPGAVPQGLGYTPMPTAAPPTAQARLPLR